MVKGNTYRFDNIAPSILGMFNNVKIIGDGDIDTINLLNLNIDILNLNDMIVSLLGVSSIPLNEKLFYIVKDIVSNNISVIAYDWVIDSTIELMDGKSYVVKLDNMPSTKIGTFSKYLKQGLPQGATATITSL